MDYVMLGALLLGGFLFVLGWLMVVVAGFQRHPLTGLLALVPGVNLLTLPSLWQHIGAWVISGLVGVVLAAGAWFAGAGDVLARYLSAKHPAVAATSHTTSATTPVTPVPPPTPAATMLQTAASDSKQPAVANGPAVTTPEPAPVAAPAVAPAATRITQDLPKAALYRVTFSELALEKLPGQVGQYVRITQKDGGSHEGKLLSSTDGSLELEERQGNGRVTRRLPLSDIRTAALLTSQGGD
ncbi:MAG: hypothetical protein ACK4RS_01780 [Thiothrix sp.]